MFIIVSLKKLNTILFNISLILRFFGSSNFFVNGDTIYHFQNQPLTWIISDTLINPVIPSLLFVNQSNSPSSKKNFLFRCLYEDKLLIKFCSWLIENIVLLCTSTKKIVSNESVSKKVLNYKESNFYVDIKSH